MIRGSSLARRVNSARLLMGTITLTVLITAALGAALASFATQSLPQAMRAQLGPAVLVAAVLAVLPVLAAAARAARGPGPAAELRAAEAS
jgi:hypothetical protein